MTLLADHQIAALCRPLSGSCPRQPMISPYQPAKVRCNEQGERVITYGPEPYGYDIRVGRKFKIFTNLNSRVVDPKNFDEQCLIEVEQDVCLIPPNSYVLAPAMERFVMPRDVTGLVLTKSTYARCGILTAPTVLIAGWEGELVLEFTNSTSLPAKIYAGEGAAHVMFLQGDYPPTFSYHELAGKYMNQQGIQLPKV